MYNKLQQDGFVIIDVIDKKEVQYLNDLCKKYLKTEQQDFISGSHFLSKEENVFINQELHQIVKPITTKLFPELELLGGTLATKMKGKTTLKAHNDWNIVDEKRFNSYNLWLSLVDTDKNNGTLGLIPNSHLWQHGHRGFGIPGNFEQYTRHLIPLSIEPNLKAGQAILYNHKLIHFSRSNTTNQPRNVAIIGMKDRGAPLQISLSTDGKYIETYGANQSDFYGFNIENIKKNQLLTREEIPQKQLSFKQISDAYYQHLSKEFKSEIQLSFIDKIRLFYANLFG